jgi:hypothetical protein
MIRYALLFRAGIRALVSHGSLGGCIIQDDDSNVTNSGSHYSNGAHCRSFWRHHRDDFATAEIDQGPRFVKFVP